MNLHTFHNTIRKLFNIEWGQLDFLTDAQKDNFFENPPRFFIAADDETAEKLWGVMFPKPPEAKSGAKDAGKVVVDLDRYRKAAEVRPRWPGYVERKYDYWCPPVTHDFEYDIGRTYPLPGTTSRTPPRTYIVNGVTGDVTPRAS
jgi:hypothetical protein